MHADIDERTEVGDVGDNAFEDHARLQVLEVLDAVLKFCGLELRTRVAARFFEFLQNVGDGRQTKDLVGELLRVQTLEKAGVADQRTDVAVGFSRNTLHQRVGFRVNGRRVQRVVTGHDAQEACGLLKGLFAQTADFLQRCAGLERTVFIAMRDDILCQRGVEAGNSRQQRHRRSVYVHAHGVHAVFNHRIQAASQFELRHIVLVLADTNGFRIDFHQFGQRVLQAAGNRYCATDRHVEVREFLGGQFRRRVHRCAGFGNHDLGHFQAWVFFDQVGGQLVGFAAGGAVTDGYQIDRVLGAQGRQYGDGLIPLVLWHMRVNCRVVEQLAGGIHYRHLAAGAQAWVQAQRGALPSRGGEQQVVQVVGENVDGFGFGAFTQLTQQIGFEVAVQLDLPGPAHHFGQPFVRRAALVLDAETLADHQFARVHGTWQFFTDFQCRAEKTFVAATENRQRAVRRHAFERLVVFKVVTELGAFLFLARHHARADHRFLLEEAAQFFQ